MYQTLLPRDIESDLHWVWTHISQYGGAIGIKRKNFSAQTL